MEFINKIKQNYEQWARVTPQGLLYDRALFWLFVVLLLIGLVAVTSASMPYSARVFNDTFYFAKRDAVYVLLSLATCYLSPNFFFSMGKVARKSLLVSYCFINTGSWYRYFC